MYSYILGGPTRKVDHHITEEYKVKFKHKSVVKGGASKRKKKKYTKMLEKFVQNELTSELKKLTRTEGQILVKLIFRETGVSAYSLVRELRNGFRAFTYNTIARVFNISLKEKYDPLNVREDLFIEDILRNSSM